MKRKRFNLVLTFFFLFFIFVLTPFFTAQTEFNLTYDSNGNLIQGFDKYYEYNNFNQLKRVRENNANGNIISEFFYDHEGNRLKKVEPLINTTAYYVGKNFVRIVNSSGTFDEVYYYDEEDLIARKSLNKTNFYHPDHLGSTSLVTNESGIVVEETSYLPYGEIIEGGESRYLYTGKEKDTSTDLYYYGSRYYDPYFKHFIQPDLIIPDLYNPQDLNRYAYARNNPYKYTDPSGNYISPLDIVDYISLAHSVYLLYNDPSLSNFGFFGLDVVSAAVPIIGGAGAGAKIGKYSGKIDDLSSLATFFNRVDRVEDISSSLNKGKNSVDIFKRDAQFRNKIKFLGERGKKTIEVKSFEEAGALLKASFPEAVEQVGKSKPNTYRIDLIDPNTGLVAGHSPTNPHAFDSHINILDVNKDSKTIIIKGR